MRDNRICNRDLNLDSLTLEDLTADRLVATDSTKLLVSTDIDSWIAGTTFKVTVIDDGDGTVTLTTPTVEHHISLVDVGSAVSF